MDVQLSLYVVAHLAQVSLHFPNCYIIEIHIYNQIKSRKDDTRQPHEVFITTEEFSLIGMSTLTL